MYCLVVFYVFCSSFYHCHSFFRRRVVSSRAKTYLCIYLKSAVQSSQIGFVHLFLWCLPSLSPPRNGIVYLYSTIVDGVGSALLVLHAVDLDSVKSVCRESKDSLNFLIQFPCSALYAIAYECQRQKYACVLPDLLIRHGIKTIFGRDQLKVKRKLGYHTKKCCILTRNVIFIQSHEKK